MFASRSSNFDPSGARVTRVHSKPTNKAPNPCKASIPASASFDSINSHRKSSRLFSPFLIFSQDSTHSTHGQQCQPRNSLLLLWLRDTRALALTTTFYNSLHPYHSLALRLYRSTNSTSEETGGEEHMQGHPHRGSRQESGETVWERVCHVGFLATQSEASISSRFPGIVKGMSLLLSTFPEIGYVWVRCFNFCERGLSCLQADMAGVLSGKLQSWNASETLQTHSYRYLSERIMLLSFCPNSESCISNVGELFSRIFQNISYLESPLFICGLSQFHMHGIERLQVTPQISGNSSAGRRTFSNTRQMARRLEVPKVPCCAAHRSCWTRLSDSQWKNFRLSALSSGIRCKVDSDLRSPPDLPQTSKRCPEREQRELPSYATCEESASENYDLPSAA